MTDAPPTLVAIDYQPPAADVPDLYCPHCNGPTVRGEVGRRNASRFYPTFVGNVFVVNGGVQTAAFACQDCGIITLVVEKHQQARLARLARPRMWSRRIGALVGHMSRPFANRRWP